MHHFCFRIRYALPTPRTLLKDVARRYETVSEMSAVRMKNGSFRGRNAVNSGNMKPYRNGRALPDFLIIGAQKSATTSLLSYIGRHSHVRLGGKKAVHFFDFNHHRGADWYAGHFPRVRQWPLSFFSPGKGTERDWLTGESCPSYMFLPDVPRRVRELLPDVKIVVILRNPVDRLISNYQHERRKGRTEESFENFIAPSLLSGWPAVGDMAYVRQRCAVPRGFYVDQLRHWQRYFPIQRFLVLSFEDLVKNTPATLNGVFEFLGIEQQTVDTSTVLNRGTGGKPPVIAQGLRHQLEDLYRQKNAGLEGITGRKFGWF